MYIYIDICLGHLRPWQAWDLSRPRRVARALGKRVRGCRKGGPNTLYIYIHVYIYIIYLYVYLVGPWPLTAVVF